MDLSVEDRAVEVAVALKAYFLVVALGVPHCEAVEEYSLRALGETEGGSHLIAVAVVVPVGRVVIVECNALGVVYKVALAVLVAEDKEGVDVAKEVSAALEHNACLNSRYSHIGKSIIVSLDKNADRIGHIVTDYVYGLDVSIGRAVVSAASDVKSEEGMLDGYVANRGLASALDSDTVSNHITVDDTALKVIVASVSVDCVIRLSRAESYHSLLVIPALSSLKDSKVGELERNCGLGLTRGADRLCKNILTVGEIDGLHGVGVDDALNSIGNVLTRISLKIICNYNVAQSVCVGRVHIYVLTFRFDFRLLPFFTTLYHTRKSKSIPF